MTPIVALTLCAILAAFVLITVVAIRIDKHRNTCPSCNKPLVDWTRGELPFGLERREHLYCETCDAYFLQTWFAPKPADAPRHIKYSLRKDEALRTRWLRKTELGDVEAIQITKPGRVPSYPIQLQCSADIFEKLVNTAAFLERYKLQTPPDGSNPGPDEFHIISLNGKLSAIPVECHDPDFLSWLELLHKTDVPLHPLWRLELDGQPVADLYQVHLDWPWYLYEVVPLTGQNEINAALKTAVFFNDEMDRLKYRLIESGELAELKPLCQVHGNHVLLRGPYMKAPR